MAFVAADFRPAARFTARDLFDAEPRFAAGGLLMVALIAPTLVAFGLEERTIDGTNMWLKPLKFQISLALYLFTLTLFARWAPKTLTQARWYPAYSTAVVTAIALEMAWIGGAASLGTASHFNDSSPFWMVAYAAMGVAAVVLTSASLVLGIFILRDGRSALSPAMRAALAQGLIATFVLTLLAAGYMSSSGSHFVAIAPDRAEMLPVMGWARNGGDLRVPHFFATHAMHFVPLFGLVSAWAFGRGRTWPVSLFTAFFALFTLWTLLEAMAGNPFLP